MISEKVTEDMFKDIAVTDEEAETYYKDNPDAHRVLKYLIY